MITHIRTKGFKGFDLDENIPEKVIYTGPNRAGKSARSQAIAIALYGYIPWSTAGKRPSDILDSFGDGKSLVCAATIDGKEFARKFQRSNSGVVSQSFQIDKKKQSKENFAIMLSKSGAPKIADVAAFIAQSDTKIVDTLFDLYPNPELADIDQEIDDAKEDISRINKKIDDADSTIKRLSESKSSIQLPAGSIAEIQEEIRKTNLQIEDYERQIKEAEIAEAEAKAADMARKQEQERIEAEKLEIEPPKTDQDWSKHDLESPANPEMAELDQTITQMENQNDGFSPYGLTSPEPYQADVDDGNFVPDMSHQIIGGNQIESINRIIDAMIQAGCKACAALIVAKQELKKYEK